MSKDKDDSYKGIRNANLMNAGQKMNIDRDENGKQHNFTKAAQERPDKKNIKPEGKTFAEHAHDTTPKK